MVSPSGITHKGREETCLECSSTFQAIHSNLYQSFPIIPVSPAQNIPPSKPSQSPLPSQNLPALSCSLKSLLTTVQHADKPISKERFLDAYILPEWCLQVYFNKNLLETFKKNLKRRFMLSTRRFWIEVLLNHTKTYLLVWESLHLCMPEMKG